MADTTARHFLPWVRHGTPNAIATLDSLTRNQRAHVSVPVTATLNLFPVTKEVRLYGPGDVTSLPDRAHGAAPSHDDF